MPHSSNSISSTSLPFGVDIHIHATTRRSGSIPRSGHRDHGPAVYNQGPQTYAALVADVRASDAVSRLSNAHIPPSSIKSIPRSHKKVLRQHSVLLWVVIVMFLISLIALTAAIVLGAVKAHQHGKNDVKCAAIIVGVFAFSGLVGSAAVVWLILTGRKERARLEKHWADEERLKEAASIWEHQTESQLRKIIRDRGRSLSRSRSRGRDRNRPSFKDMTPTPTSSTRMRDDNAQSVSRRARRAHTPWPSHIEASSDVDEDFNDSIHEEKYDEKHDEKKDEDSNNNNNGSKDQNEGGHDEEVKARATQERRNSASTSFQDLDPSGSENDDNNRVDTASRSNIDILEKEILSQLSLPLDESTPLPASPDTSQISPMPLKSSTTYINTPPMDPSPVNLGPSNPPRAPPIKQAPFGTATVRSNHLDIGNAHGVGTTPREIPGWKNGGLGSAQSDENFLAMLDLADDVGSEDEKDREIRRQKGKEKVEEWASTLDPEAEGGEREEKGKRLREAVERGLKRVANRKKERRLAVLGAKARVQGEGSERRR